MLIGRMVGYEIENDLDAAPMRLAEETVDIVHAAKQRVDAAVLHDVVAEIGHGGRKEWRNPHRVDAKPSQIVETADNAIEVTDTIAVRIQKRTRVDVVDD